MVINDFNLVGIAVLSPYMFFGDHSTENEALMGKSVDLDSQARRTSNHLRAVRMVLVTKRPARRDGCIEKSPSGLASLVSSRQ
jgi:hypothetical protein